MTTTEELALPPLPEGLTTAPVPRSRYDAGHFPKRNDIVLYPGKETWGVYRVAKVESRSSSFPSIWLVDADAEPNYGDGSAYVHYEGQRHTSYWQATVGGIARAGARLLDTDTDAGDRFLGEHIVAERLRKQAQVEAEDAWRTGPGGVAERLVQRVSSLRWQAKDLRGTAAALDRAADEIEADIVHLQAHAGEKP